MTRPARATPSLPLLRRIVPLLILPLGLVSCVLASAPWLRAFPSGVMAVPLVGTALLSVLLPVVVIAIGIRRLWLTALIDVVGFVFFTTLVTLREPFALSMLWDGLVHGPSQILTFALPLVSPRTLLVAPIALCWICGAIIGECIGRGWQSVVPYATALVTFGLAYAATTRAVTSSGDGRRYDTVLAGALLLALLLLRAAQAWIEQDGDADAAQADGVLPLRGLAVGAAVSIVVAAVAALVVQSSAFTGPAATAERTPPLDRSQPLTPLSFVAGLRPDDPRSGGRKLFDVSVDRTASRYVAIADVDTYDGDGWSFDRQFRPSGGVVPADADPSARTPGADVRQRYRIAAGPLTSAPWMPFQYRPQDISGLSVNIDQTSGMIVPSERLRAGQSYTVASSTPRTGFGALPPTALTGTSPPPSATFLPATVRRSINTVVTSLQSETNTTGAPAVRFLQAVLTDFRTNYSLSGGTTPGGPSSPARFVAPTPTTSKARTSKSPTPKPTSAAPSASSTEVPSTGGNSFAGVLASILGPTRSATPEQYATLVALLARAQGVPSRVVTGFRVGSGDGTTVPAGNYPVTTAQAWTWVEIPIRGRGWVVLDAAPSTYSNQKPSESASARPSPSPSPSSTPNALLTQAPADGGNAVAPTSKVPGSKTSAGTWWLVAVVVVGAVVLLVIAALVLRKRLRARRRRRQGDPRRRLIGAWHETLDVLAESGLHDLDALTSAEVSAAAATRFDGETAAQARFVGDSANAAIFSPTSWVGPDEAAAAWRVQAELRRRVRRSLTVRERMGAGLRYRRVRKPRPLVGPASWADAAKATPRARRGRTARHSSRGR